MIYLGQDPVGIALKKVGEYTKHQHFSVLPNSSSYFEIEYSLGVTPKLIVLDGVFTREEGDSTNYVVHGLFDQEAGIGVMYDNAKTQYTVSLDTWSNQVGYVYIDNSNSKFRIMRATSARIFYTTCQYDIDIYA